MCNYFLSNSPRKEIGPYGEREKNFSNPVEFEPTSSGIALLVLYQPSYKDRWELNGS